MWYFQNQPTVFMLEIMSQNILYVYTLCLKSQEKQNSYVVELSY